MSPTPLSRLFAPERVAVVGASDDLHKFGARVLHNARTGGFDGELVPVNPRRATVQGLAALPRVCDIGRPVDVAVIAVPREHVLNAVEDCAAAGAAFCVVITAGFTEMGPRGADLESRIVAIAHEAGMRLIGPNCLGLLNTHASLALNSSPAMQNTPMRPGRIGFLSQSGALMATAYNRGVQDGATFSCAVSIGNQADLELADFMEFMVEDVHTEVVTLYVEGFKNPSRFLHAARRLRAAGKPVLMVKAGRTEEGAGVAFSHTASIASSAAVLDAVCRDVGVVLVDDITGLLQSAAFYARHGPASGDGICVFSGSGGMAAITADRLREKQLRLARFAPETMAALSKLYDPAQFGNPLGYGEPVGDAFNRADEGGLAVAAADPDVSVVLDTVTTQPMLTESTLLQAKATQAAGTPAMFVLVPGSAADGARTALDELSIARYDTLDEALRVLQAWIPSSRPRPVTPLRPADLPQAIPFSELADGAWDERAVLPWLRRCGIAVAREGFATSEAEAVAAATEIGYPVVMKGVAAELVHKSDAGAVRVDLADEAVLRDAWHAIHAATPMALEGCLVAEMVHGETEAFAGIQCDSQFGPMVVFGLGGVLIEILDDVQMAPAPISAAHALSLMGKLKGWPVLEGTRGRPALDVNAFADLVSRLSWLAHDAGERVQELDVNPVMLGVRGAKAVDGRMRLGTKRSRAAHR